MFGLVYYGPLQHFWYAFLNGALPTGAVVPLVKRIPAFAAKVALNQVVLGPVVVSSIFLWTLACQGRLGEFKQKMEKDFKPTLIRGWCDTARFCSTQTKSVHVFLYST